MDEPRHALPVIRPRCCLRYLTFFGIIMTASLLRVQASIPARRALPVSIGAGAASRAARLDRRSALDGPCRRERLGWAAQRVQKRRERAHAAAPWGRAARHDRGDRDARGHAAARAPATYRACALRRPEFHPYKATPSRRS